MNLRAKLAMILLGALLAVGCADPPAPEPQRSTQAKQACGSCDRDNDYRELPSLDGMFPSRPAQQQQAPPSAPNGPDQEPAQVPPSDPRGAPGSPGTDNAWPGGIEGGVDGDPPNRDAPPEGNGDAPSGYPDGASPDPGWFGDGF